MLNTVAKISALIGQCEGLGGVKPNLVLRKQNHIQSIHSSLAIEGNGLSKKQVSQIVEGQAVLGSPKDILEVQNAMRLYDQMDQFKSRSLTSFLKAHGLLMKGLDPQAGRFRHKNVGVLEGSKVRHMAPPHLRVPQLMSDLFEDLKNLKSENLILVSSMLHYEIEFIHPFNDGNGRMGRFWQSVLLREHHLLFEYIAIETMVHEQQDQYYHALKESDRMGDATCFVQWMSDLILMSVKMYVDQFNISPQTAKMRIERAKIHFGKKTFTRKQYLLFFKTVSTATGSRDLSWASQQGLLKKSGDKRLTSYCFV